ASLACSRDDAPRAASYTLPYTTLFRSIRGLARQEFLVAIGNPKAILIFTAFFPQFVDMNNYWTSFMIQGVIFLLLEVIAIAAYRSEEHTSELQSRENLVCRLLLEKKK